MKTPHLLKVLLPLLFLHHCASSSNAQTQQKEVKKEEYRIKIMRQDGDKTIAIDTVFNSREDLERFHKEQLAKFKPQGMGVAPFTKKFDAESSHVQVVDGDTIHKHNVMFKKHLGENDTDFLNFIATHKDLFDENLHKDILMHNADTAAMHQMIIKHFSADSLHDVIKFIPADAETFNIELPDDYLIDAPQGTTMKMIRVMFFVALEEPTKDELKNNTNKEIKKAATEKNLEVNNLNVYPNPSSGNITVGFELAEKGKTQLLVTDLQGKEVYNEEFVNDGTGMQTRQLDLSGQSGGIYLLKIKTGNKSTVRKIVLRPSAE